MSELFILYCAVCYLFNAGVVVGAFKDLDAGEKFGYMFSFCFAPLILPFMLGWVYSKKNL